MIRLIHLTDFHLNPQNLKDWKSYVKEPFLSTLKELHDEKPIDLITFTGDLIDVGGKDYDSAKIAFTLFKDEVILPIITSLNLTMDRFLIIPGNHDVVRALDEEPIELGYQSYFQKDPLNISKFISESIKSNKRIGVERISDFKEFEKSLYSEYGHYYYSYFGSGCKLNINNISVGIASLNSSWRCYNKSDYANLLVGEEQLTNCLKHISDCNIKIALIHHPLDWISPIEREIISSHIHKDYDLLLVGHMHENKTSVHTGFTDSLFINIAPSGINEIRSDSRTFANGFTRVDFDKANRNVNCKYYRYQHKGKIFVLNTDAGIEGEYYQEIPKSLPTGKHTLLRTMIANIKEDHYKEMDNHLIGAKAEKGIVSIKDGFILPPINQGEYSKEEDERDKNLDITDITKSPENQIFFGNQESGKTTLLFRLIREYIDDYEYLRKIPVYINLEEIGNKEIITSIKEYLRCGTEDANFLLKENHLVLLLDNLNFKKNGYQAITEKINRFSLDFQSIKIVATAENYLSGILPSDFISLCLIPFRRYFIRNLRAKEIKSLMKLWIPNENEIKSHERLDKMVTSFNSFSLPSTAMSVSLFLWSMENRERKPINHAVLMEIYIEIILEKLNPENIYREKFDFTNKVQLLAKIAQEMLSSDQANCSILYSKFINIIENYLKNDVAFDFDAQVIADYFLKRRIFVKHQENRIKFAYSCFFHFFIAKRMEYNPDFRGWVMEVERYYKFNKEIDYYTALTRSDESVFLTIFERFEKEFKNTDFILDQVNFDKHFSEIGSAKHEPATKQIEIRQIRENRPSDEMLEKFYNQRLEKISDPQTLLKNEGSISLEMMLIIMSNVLRNSEGVENKEAKKKAYHALVKYSMIWMVLYRESLIDYVIKNKRLPPSIPVELNLEYLLKNIPFHVQLGMYHHLGTPKLAPIILDKIKQDQKGDKITDLEKFLSVCLYSDIEGKDFPKYLKQLVKQIGNNIVRDYTLFKLMHYYYRRTREGSPNEEIYLDILTELRIRSQKLPLRLRDRVMKTIEDSKKAFFKQNEEDN